MPGVAVASSSSPIVVPGITGTTTVGAGSEHTCAATGTGVLCWGGNYRGQLGVGSVSWRPSDAPMPVALPRDVAVVKLVGGLQHTCALLADGRVFCWGSNHVGQLATGERFVQPTASLGGVRWR
jgi:alpha-tubulin suppressor-like RCC1 family protein